MLLYGRVGMYCKVIAAMTVKRYNNSNESGILTNE